MVEHLILADTHVHIHSCFNVSDVLKTAFQNFRQAANALNHKDPFVGLLFLTEIYPEQQFKRLFDQTQEFRNKDSAHALSFDHLHIDTTQEPISLIVRDNSPNTLVVFAGSQIVTSEKLEVLALLSNLHIQNQQPLPVTLQKILDEGGLPVLPWGVGKWIGHRGDLVSHLLEDDSKHFFLGDNSGRPSIWHKPLHFDKAMDKGLRVLPGTDPLPLPWESSRVGTFGFITYGSLDLNYPARSIKKLMLDPHQLFETYGSLENPVRFVKNQSAIRLGFSKHKS